MKKFIIFVVMFGFILSLNASIKIPYRLGDSFENSGNLSFYKNDGLPQYKDNRIFSVFGYNTSPIILMYDDNRLETIQFSIYSSVELYNFNKVLIKEYPDMLYAKNGVVIFTNNDKTEYVAEVNVSTKYIVSIMTKKRYQFITRKLGL